MRIRSSQCLLVESVEQRVLEGLLVPYACGVEDKDFKAFLTAEDHVGVEGVSVPH